MDDATYAELLGSIDRPRMMHAAERLRLVTRVNEAVAVAEGRDPLPVVVEVEVEVEMIRSGALTRRQVMRTATLRVAAAVLLLAGLVVWAPWADTDADVKLASDARADGYRTSCTGVFEQLIEGVEAWRGLENWAFATMGEPDLADAMRSAATAFVAVDPDNAVFASIRDRFARDLAAADDGVLPLLFGESTDRQGALRVAIDALADELDSEPAAASCRTAALRAAVQ